MIQIIIFLSALSSSVFAEVCKDPATNFTSFAGDLPDGQDPGKFKIHSYNNHSSIDMSSKFILINFYAKIISSTMSMHAGQFGKKW